MSFYAPTPIVTTPPDNDLVVEAMIKINENFAAIDGSIHTALNGLDPQNSVITKSLSAAPTTGLSVGARYIVAATPASGDAWYGKVDQIAELTATTPAYAWEFIVPNKGFNLTVEDENLEYVYTGSSWASRPSVEQHNQLGGLQGGSASERFHVSEANATGLAAGYLPTADQKAALAGTQGSPNAANPFVTTSDARLTNVVTQTQTITAGADLVKYQLVYSLNGLCYPADATSAIPQAVNVFGIVYDDAISAGNTGLIIINPTLITNAAWSLVQGYPYYLSTNGAFTITRPDNNSVFVGIAASPTSLMFNPNPSSSWPSIIDIDTDRLELKYAPQNYIPSLTPNTTALEQLAAHIHALDLLIGPLVAASANPKASVIPIADGSAKLDAWISASAVPTRNTIPFADNYGTLDAWVTVGNLLLAIAPDLLELDYQPQSYTPTQTAAAASLGQLATHLAGIDATLKDILARLAAHSI